MALARTLPPKLIFQGFLCGLSNVYHALQQWEEARSMWEKAEAMTEMLDLTQLRVVILSQLCMNYTVAGQWEQAHTYAVKTKAVRESYDRAMILLDFSPQYETEALLCKGDESQAKAEVHRIGERLGPSPRFRLPYPQSLAALAAWDGRREQAIGHFREAAGLAADMELPAEQWQIHAAWGRCMRQWASLHRLIGAPARRIRTHPDCGRAGDACGDPGREVARSENRQKA